MVLFLNTLSEIPLTLTPLLYCDICGGESERRHSWAKTKGRNGAGMEIVRLRKNQITPIYLNIFLFGKKSDNLWDNNFKKI